MELVSGQHLRVVRGDPGKDGQGGGRDAARHGGPPGRDGERGAEGEQRDRDEDGDVAEEDLLPAAEQHGKTAGLGEIRETQEERDDDQQRSNTLAAT